MALKVLEFSTAASMELYFNGGIPGGRALNVTGGVVAGLHGLTLILGASTVTFSDPAGNGLTLAAIKAAIEAGAAGVTVSFEKGAIMLHKAGGLTVTKTGTSNPVFGYSSSVDEVGTNYNGPSGAVPRVIEAGPGARLDSYFAIVEV